MTFGLQLGVDSLRSLLFFCRLPRISSIDRFSSQERRCISSTSPSSQLAQIILVFESNWNACSRTTAACLQTAYSHVVFSALLYCLLNWRIWKCSSLELPDCLNIPLCSRSDSMMVQFEVAFLWSSENDQDTLPQPFALPRQLLL